MYTKGKFIVLEGLDGSGQTTQAKLAREYLENKGISAIATKEPTNNPPLGTLIREVLQKKHSLAPDSFQLLFCADRSEHVKNTILPSLKKHRWVVSDRYFYTTVAYGSMNCDTNWLVDINSEFPVPDLVIFIDTAPQECLKRIDTNRGEREFFEEEDKLREIRKIYHEKIFNFFPYIRIVDGNKPIEEVFEQIRYYIDMLLE